MTIEQTHADGSLGARQGSASWRMYLLEFSRFGLLVISAAYTLCYLLWRVLLQSAWYEQLWVLPLSQVLASWFYLPLMVLIPLALLLRDRRSALALLIPCCLFAATYGRQFLPNWNVLWQAQAGQEQVRVLTWNMLYSSDPDGDFREEVRALEPDIIALQEVGWRTGANLSEWFGEEYPFQHVTNAGGSNGLALLSRYPIIDTPPRDVSLMACMCQQVTIDVHGEPLTIINAHPWRPRIYFGTLRGRVPIPTGFSLREQDVILGILIERVAAVDGSLLLVGDLNTTESQPNMQKLRQYLGDSFGEAGWGMGYTYHSNPLLDRPWSLFPVVRIDHVLHSHDWIATNARTDALSGSDHRYLVVELAKRRTVTAPN